MILWQPPFHLLFALQDIIRIDGYRSDIKSSPIRSNFSSFEKSAVVDVPENGQFNWCVIYHRYGERNLIKYAIIIIAAAIENQGKG